MKSIFISVALAFTTVSFAQKLCCSATQSFANLGNQNKFKLEHQLPKQNVGQEHTGIWQEFATEDGKTGRGYLVKAKTTSTKYLFVFHEWWGLNDNIMREVEEWSRKLPSVNIIALDLYDGKIGTTREAAAELMQGADEVRIRAIIEGARTWAGDDAAIATIGWCFGGGWSLQAALQLQDQAVGCVLYYGMPEQDVQRLSGLNCKVVGLFAEQDGWINREVVAKYEKAMSDAGKAYETHWYDAKHAFANPSNPVFNEDAATKANAISTNYLIGIFGE